MNSDLSNTSLLQAFKSLLPKGTGLLVGSVALQCIALCMLFVVGVSISQHQGISIDEFLPSLFLGSAIAVLLFVTSVFLVVMQKRVGVYLCRFSAYVWVFASGLSLWYVEDDGTLFWAVGGFIAAFIVVVLYSTSFLNDYVERARAVRRLYLQNQLDLD